MFLFEVQTSILRNKNIRFIIDELYIFELACNISQYLCTFVE